MADKVLLDGIVEDCLLHRQRCVLGFPPLLESRFEADTREGRSRSMAVASLVGTVIGALLYPTLIQTLPDVARFTRLFYLEGVLPIGVIATWLLWLDLKPLLRELVQCVALVLTIVCVTSLYAISHVANPPTFVGAVMLLIAYGAVGAHLRFVYALALTATSLGAFVLETAGMAGLSGQSRHNILAIIAVFSVYMLWANWRHEAALRASYLFGLQERLRRQTLSVHNAELQVMTRHDALTGLANRRGHDLWLADCWRQADMAGHPVGLIVIDVDWFKNYNDFYGHAMGDACLQAISCCLRDQARGTSDLVARLGGEEFSVLLPGLAEDTCGDIADRLRAAVEELQLPHLGVGAAGIVTISVGVASQALSAGATSASLFAAADAALYQAKEFGRNRVCIATSVGVEAA